MYREVNGTEPSSSVRVPWFVTMSYSGMLNKAITPTYIKLLHFGGLHPFRKYCTRAKKGCLVDKNYVATLGITTFSITTISITTFSITTFSLTTFSITTFSITTQKAECRFTWCHSAECRCAKKAPAYYNLQELKDLQYRADAI